MTPARTPEPPIEPSDPSETVQLLVADDGNRSAISEMLDEHFDVETSQTVTDADLYLIEDHLFPEYRAALRERIEREKPAFCPVVLIRRESTTLGQLGADPSGSDGGVRYDDVVDAPINPPQLIRRLNSLLVRRQQSQELMQQVSTLEEREQRLRLFEQGVESTGNGVVMIDPTGTIEYVNPALESIAGYTEDDLLGESPQILLPGGSGEVFDDAFWRTMTDQREWESDLIIEGKDSTRLVVKATATALSDPDDETQGFVIVLSDVTERIQREQDLEDREVELDLLRQILTRYLRHNLRNDLNLIQGNAELLKEDETLSPAQSELAETIIETSEDLLEMSDSARTYSSLLEREADLSTFELSEITTDAVQDVRERFPDVDFEIDAPEMCDIRAREGIQRAFEELIDNAARHNDGAEPWVRINVRDRDGARLVVEDNGPGISEQERSALERGTETQLSHGQGVGLWLSKWLIEGVNGELSIEQSDSGTRVIADFPPPARVGSTGLEVTTLKERERRLQTVTDRMTDAIVEIDADWNVTTLDGPAEEMLDIDADSVLADSFWDVFSDLRDTQFEGAVRNAMESRSSRSVEAYVAEIDAWLEFNVYPEFDGGLSLYTRDITERKKRERRAEEMKVRYQTLVEAAPDAVVVADSATGEIIEVSEAAETLLGMSREDIIGSYQSEFHPADQTELYQQHFEKHAQTGGTLRRLPDGSPLIVVTDNGDHVPVEISASTVQLPDGLVTYGIFRDISEQVERERQIERQKAKFQGIFEKSFDAMVIADDDGRYIDVNESATDLFGVSEDELLGRSIAEFAPEDLDFAEAWRDFKELENERGTFPLVRPDGDERIVEFAATRDIVPGKHLAVLRDITERRERERRYNAIFNQTYQFTALLEPEGTVVEVNEPALEFGGFDREDVVGTPFWEAEWWQIDDATQQEVREAIDRASTGEFVRYDAEVQGVDETAIIDFSLQPIADEQGTVTELIAEGRDITVRKEREHELAEQRADLRLFERAAEVSTDLIGAVDTEYNLIFANERYRRFHGFKEDDIVGKPAAEVIGDTWESEVKPRVDRVLGGEAVQFDMDRTGADGELRSFDIRFYPIPGEDGTTVGVVGAMRDITERKLQERKREQIIDRVTDAIVEVDANWRFTLVNEQAAELYDMSEESLLGRDFWTVFEAARDTTFEEEYRGVMESREPTSFVEYFPQLDGWFDIKAYPKDDGGIAFYFVEVTDQYERKRDLEQANETLSTLFETIPAGVTVLDTEGRITRTNAFAEEELGLVQSELTDRTYQDPEWEIFGADGEPLPAEELPFSQVMETGETVLDYEHGIVLPDGSKRWLSINAAPITGNDGAIEKVVAVIRDLTDRRDYQEHLEAKTSDPNE